MKKLFRIDESEKKRILSMHTNATSRQYLSEQVTTSDYNDIKNALAAATGGAGTLEDELVDAFKLISPVAFDDIITKLQADEINGKKGLNELLSDELGWGDLGTMNNISNIFKERSKKYGVQWTTSGLRNQEVSNVKIVDKGNVDTTYSDFYSKFPCFKAENIKQNPNTQKDQNGFYYFVVNGNTYVRVKLDGTTEILKNNNYERQYKDDAKTELAKSYCPSTVTESKIRLKEQQMAFIPGVDSKPTQQQGDQSAQGGQQQSTQQQGNRARSGSSGLLKRGSKGEEVKGVKSKLNTAIPKVIEELGVDVDSEIYDGKTVAAVAYFQAINNLKVDGIVGPETRGELSKITLDDQGQGGEQQSQQNNPTAGEGTA